MVAALKGDKNNQGGRDALFYHYYEYPDPHKVSPHFGIRTKRFKLIRFYGPADQWELYDLGTDPTELHNLYGEKGREKITKSLKRQLADLARQFRDEEAVAILQRPCCDE